MAQRDEIVRFIYEVTGDADLAATATTMLKVAEAGGNASEEVTKFTDQLRALADQSATVDKAIDLQAKLDATTKSLDQAKQSLADLNAEFTRGDKSSADITVAFQQAQKQVTSLAAAQLKLQNSYANTTASLKSAGVDTANLGAANDALKTKAAGVAAQLAATAGGLKDSAASTKSLGDESQRSAGLLNTLRDNLGKIVSVAASVKVALKGITFARDAFSGAADIEASLARVKAIAQTTSESFAQLGDQIDKSAIAANVSTTEAAAAAAALAEQGENANQIFQTLTPTLLLAKDAQIDVAQAAGIVSDAIDLFGMDASQAATLVDQLVVASKGSKDGITGLATAMRALAPDAQQLGLSAQQLVGLLGLMGQNGLDAQKATKGLRTVFQDLENPTSTLSLALGQLGDSSGNFTKAIETLRTSGPQGQKALEGLDGSARSLVLFLLQQAPGAVDAFTASLSAAGGAASKTAQTIDTTLTGSFTSFQNALDRLGEGLLKTSLDPFRQELQKLADQLTAFAASPAFAQLGDSLATLFKNGTDAFDTFIQSLDWNQFVQGAQTAVADAGQSILQFKDDLAGVAESINTIGAALGVVYRSIAVVFDLTKTALSGVEAAATVGTLAASQALDKLTGHTSTLTLALESVLEASKNAANDGLGALRDNSDKLVTNLKTVGGAADDTGKKVESLGASFANVKAGSTSVNDASDSAVIGFNAITGAVENSANALGILPELFNADATAANAAAAAHNAHADAIRAAREAVAAAEAALVKLAESGDLNTVAFQQASNALQQAQAELDRLTGKTDTAAASQRALAQAFKDLHITSQAELLAAATDAERNLGIIQKAFQDGKATIEDEERAYASYAATVKASVADSSAAVQAQAQAQVDAQASALGLQPILIAAGNAGEDAGKKTASAYQDAKQSLDDTADAAKGVAKSTTEAAAAASHIGDTARSSADAMGGVVAMTEQSSRALTVMNDILGRTGTLANVSLDQAQYLLQNLGAYAGGQAQVLTQRINELQQAAQQAEDTAKRMADEASSLQDQIDQLQGNDTDIEDRRHAQKLADLKDEATQSGTLNSAAYSNLVNLEDQLHELKLKNIQTQADQAAQAAQASKDSQAAATQKSSSASGSSTTNINVPAAPAINVNGVDLLSLNATQLASLGRQLAGNPAAITAILQSITQALRSSARNTGLFAQ